MDWRGTDSGRKVVDFKVYCVRGYTAQDQRGALGASCLAISSFLILGAVELENGERACVGVPVCAQKERRKNI